MNRVSARDPGQWGYLMSLLCLYMPSALTKLISLRARSPYIDLIIIIIIIIIINHIYYYN
jgi:hypothetical protein